MGRSGSEHLISHSLDVSFGKTAGVVELEPPAARLTQPVAV
jgi:hypothetical protein